MRKAIVLIFVLGMSLCLFCIQMLITRSFLCTFLAFVCLLCLGIGFLSTAFYGVSRWRKTSRWWMIPALACLVFMSTPFIGVFAPTVKFIEDWRFKWHLDDYARIVTDVKSGIIPCDNEFRPQKVDHMPPGVLAIRAVRCDNGRVQVDLYRGFYKVYFFNGYIYSEIDESDSCIDKKMLPQSWPYVRHIVGNWYHVSDQPSP